MRSGYSSVGLSTALAAVLVVVALVVGVGIGFLVAPQPAAEPMTVTEKVTVTTTIGEGQVVTVTETQTETVTKSVTQVVTQPGAQLPEEIVIGALLPLTGSLASYGENSRVAIEIAAEEINAWLSEAGIPTRVRLVIEDTETKPDVALQKLQSLAAKGIKLYVGPQTSAEVRNLKGFADANKLLLVSQSSTAPELSVPGDYIYRFVPDDTKQGPAIARAMWEDGIRYVVPIWRGDAWGDGLEKAAREAFERLGGTFDEGIRYAPEDVEKKGFTVEVEQLAAKVEALVNQQGADKVAVIVISFSEAVDLLVKANDYEVLKNVRWYGSDGTALLAELFEEPLAAEFAVQTRWLNPIFGEPNPKRSALRDMLMERLGRIPDSYAYSAYDIVWVLTLAVLTTGQYDPDAVIKAMPGILKTYSGAIGTITLNEGGDLAKSDYELWQVKKIDGEYQWVQVGGWDFETDSVSYSMEH